MNVKLHFDGYPEGVGAVLIQHYTDPLKVVELIKHGGMDSLGKEIHPDPRGPHSFENPQDDVCVFYGRDREEDNQVPSTAESLEEFWRRIQGYVFIEYVYTFDVTASKWKVDENARGVTRGMQASRD